MNVIFQRRYSTRQYYYSIERLTINASRAFIKLFRGLQESNCQKFIEDANTSFRFSNL